MFGNSSKFLAYINPLHHTIYNVTSDSIFQTLDFDKGVDVGLRGGILANIRRACGHHGNELVPQKTGLPDYKMAVRRTEEGSPVFLKANASVVCNAACRPYCL